MKELCTIGYEGVSSEDFLRNLSKNNVAVLVDVREIPLSRKKGFSKSALGQFLSQHGIKYVHIKRLGSPSKIRNRLKEDHNYKLFFKEYTDYLMKDAKDALNDLYEIAVKDNTCVMCFEKDVNFCHRSIVAKKLGTLNGTKFQVRHI